MGVVQHGISPALLAKINESIPRKIEARTPKLKPINHPNQHHQQHQSNETKTSTPREHLGIPGFAPAAPLVGRGVWYQIGFTLFCSCPDGCENLAGMTQPGRCRPQSSLRVFPRSISPRQTIILAIMSATKTN
ncbi:hypothetical protein SBV1_2780002 [Verrucomicrobia bacterium]|nr:hypothetical protein SBV1_2780002 [Verrucomicrobiota bacterium]